MVLLEGIPIWATVTFGILVFLFFVAGGIGTFIFFNNRRWNYTVHIFEDVPPYGNIPTQKDKARLISFGDGGEQIFYLKRFKKYRTAHGRLIGKNTIAFAIDPISKQWFNVSFEGIDTKLKKIGVSPVHLDARYANSSLRKGIEKTYDDRSFFDKYAVPITIGMLILAIIIQAIAIWFIMTKLLEVMSAITTAIEASKEVTIASKELLNALANNQNVGSGLKVA